MRAILLLLALIAPFGSASAQHPLVAEKLETWNAAAPVPDHSVLEAQIRNKALEIHGADGGCGGSAIKIDAVTPATADRNAFNAVIRGTMRNAWFVTARMPGCDDAPVRFMVMQAADASLRTIRVNRGTSHAWESLIGDTLPLVQLSAMATLAREGTDCSGERAVLGVTRIVSEGPGLGDKTFGIRYEGRWSEVWPIEICGRRIEFTVDFAADGDGGAHIHIPGEQIRITS